MHTSLKELLPERRIHPLMQAAEQANGFCFAHASWRIPRRPDEVSTDDFLGVIDEDLEVRANLWFRRSWSGRDGRPRREACYALAIYIPQRNERHLYLEHSLDAALAHLLASGYDPGEKCWIIDDYDQVHRCLLQKDADILWNRDDFGRDLASHDCRTRDRLIRESE